MRILWIALSFSMLSSYEAFADRGYGRAGCGLGSIVMGPTGNQSSAVTTNGIGANQPFAISSGTSNCIPDNEMAAVMKQEDFMVNNYSVISREMAQGSGTSLQGLFATLGCPVESFPHIAAFLQKEYEQIYSQPGALAALDMAKSLLQKDKKLASECVNLG